MSNFPFMSYIKYFTVSVLLSIILVGCSNDASTNELVEMEHSHDHSDDLELNHGERWKVVPDMMQHIKSMNKSVDDFNGEDYEGLGLSLKDDLNLLTSNCTMTGRAHDELHKWLLPYIDLVDELNDAKSEELKSSYHKIVESFEEFNEFFE